MLHSCGCLILSAWGKGGATDNIFWWGLHAWVAQVPMACASCCCLLGCGGGRWHKAMVVLCFPLTAPIGLSPLNFLPLCGSEICLLGCVNRGPMAKTSNWVRDVV